MGSRLLTSHPSRIRDPSLNNAHQETARVSMSVYFLASLWHRSQPFRLLRQPASPPLLPVGRVSSFYSASSHPSSFRWVLHLSQRHYRLLCLHSLPRDDSWTYGAEYRRKSV